jgi:hypothetical protein
MKIPAGIRRLARQGRAILLPISSLRRHLSALTRRTGKELYFDNGIIQRLEVEVETTLHEMGIDK